MDVNTPAPSEARILSELAPSSVYYTYAQGAHKALVQANTGGQAAPEDAVAQVRDAVLADDSTANEYFRAWANSWTLPTTPAKQMTVFSDPGPFLSIAPDKQERFAYQGPTPRSLDPHNSSSVMETQLVVQMFEGLVALPPDTQSTYRFGLAERIAVSERGDHYEFTLRPGLTWSDGTPLIAQTFIDSWHYALQKSNGVSEVADLFVIKNAKAYYNRTIKDFSRVGITAPNKHTVHITLEHPNPEFLAMMPSSTGFIPIPTHVSAKHGKQWSRPEHIVSNGAYQLESWKHGEVIRLEKNPRYWDHERVAVDEVINYLGESEHTAAQFYELGKVDWVFRVPNTKVPELLANASDDLQLTEPYCTYMYGLGMDNPTWANKALRQAMWGTIDRGRLTRQVLNRMGSAARGVVPPIYRQSHGHRTPHPKTPRDPMTARATLTKLGYTNERPLQLTLNYNTSDQHRSIAEFVQRGMKTFGIEVTLNNMEWKTLLDTVIEATDKSYDLVRYTWCADSPSPMNFLEIFHSQHEANFVGYKSAAYDALIEKLETTTDPAQRTKLFARAEALLQEDAPIIPLHFIRFPQLVRPGMRGFTYNGTGHREIKNVRWD